VGNNDCLSAAACLLPVPFKNKFYMVKKINALFSIADLAGAKPFAWAALYATLLAAGLTDYLPYDQANFWLGIVALVLYSRFPTGEKAGYRFLFASLIFICLYLFLPVKTLLFFALISALLFSLEAITGRLHAAIVPVIFLMSPVANYAAEVFSFPVRLHLSSWAANLLQLTGNKASAVGNTILFNGSQFDVDHACMGLSMLVCSLLMGMISIQLFEAKYHRRLPLPYLPLVLVYFTVFNVVANLIRIICLVYFQLAPGTALHELMGLACWLFYGIIPSVFLVKAMVKHVGRYESVLPVTNFHQPTLHYYQVTQLGLLIILSLLFGMQPVSENKNISDTGKTVSLEGYECQSLPHGVSGFKNESSLIYVKSIMGFYSTDHNPSICWRGSGYAFTKVRQANRGNATMYMANLEKDSATLYTAWWYEYGKHRTNNQLIWRWKNLQKGADYRLVNITASSKHDLERAINNWMETR
jgi:exosortase N